MPEGHTLHRLALDHDRLFAGRTVRVSSPQGRFAPEARRLDGRVFERADSWGKHLWHRYEGGAIVHVHLGLYGAFTDFGLLDGAPPPAVGQVLRSQRPPSGSPGVAPPPVGQVLRSQRPPSGSPGVAPPPVGQVRMRIVGPEGGTDLRGPTACELVTEEQVDALLARLGPDPLRRGADPDDAWRRIERSRRPIGALLMDQKVMAGVGNVYRAEVLFRAGIDPHREGREVSRAEFDGIWSDLVALMPIGVERGRMHVVRAEHDHGAPSYAPDRPRTYVYRRTGEKCRVCGTPVRTEPMEARNLYWCPVCQT